MDQQLDSQVAALMREAAERAILPRYQTLAQHEVTSKATNDVVTVADTEAEAIVHEGLSRLLPEAAIVGEEAVFADAKVLDLLSERLCWLIDPLDGTNNFAAGKPPFGMIVALVERGETIAGWLYDPLSGRLCAAHLGHGATIDGAPVCARGTGRTPPVAAISLVYMDPARREAVKRHVAPLYEVVDIPRCAAEQYPRLVLGQNDIAIFERTLPWDHAAGVLFVNEADGRVARLDGSPYRVGDDRRGMLGASSPALWDEMAERLAGLDA